MSLHSVFSVEQGWGAYNKNGESTSPGNSEPCLTLFTGIGVVCGHGAAPYRLWVRVQRCLTMSHCWLLWQMNTKHLQEGSGWLEHPQALSRQWHRSKLSFAKIQNCLYEKLLAKLSYVKKSKQKSVQHNSPTIWKKSLWLLIVSHSLSPWPAGVPRSQSRETCNSLCEPQGFWKDSKWKKNTQMPLKEKRHTPQEHTAQEARSKLTKWNSLPILH